MLTAFSVIMLPLTLIASVLGMNVGVPGEGSLHAFWITIGVMLSVLTGMVLWFRQPRLAVEGAVDAARCWELLGSARVARLATVAPDGRPSVVPVCFAIGGETIYHAVDHKPKTTRALARLDHVRAEPRAALLADHYAEDWSALWWVRADGVARVLEDGAEAQHGARSPGGALPAVPRAASGRAGGSARRGADQRLEREVAARASRARPLR